MQLAPFADTPNAGGEYKVWIMPVTKFKEDCEARTKTFGFCESASKTDNFKVKASTPAAAQVSVCVFNDFDANGTHDPGEPRLAHWPVSASGVDGGVIDAQTGDDGCVAFAYSGFQTKDATQVITLTQGSLGPDWASTAPAGGRSVISVRPGDVVQAPDFGDNNPYCPSGCTTNTLVLTATTFPSLTRAYAWTVAKTADQTRIKTTGGPATFNYTVTLTHDAGTDSAWHTTGTIRVSNPGRDAIRGITLSATVDNGGTCALTGAQAADVAAGSHAELPYRCDFDVAPAAGTVAITASWTGGKASASSPVDFASAIVKAIDGTIAVDDTLAGPLGTVTTASASAIVTTTPIIVTATSATTSAA